jgi:hypothetical protein
MVSEILNTCASGKFFMIEDFVGAEPNSMILHNRVILALVSFHVTHYFVFKLVKISVESAIICRQLLFKVLCGQLFIS